MSVPSAPTAHESWRGRGYATPAFPAPTCPPPDSNGVLGDFTPVRFLLHQEGEVGDANAGYAVVAAQGPSPVYPAAGPTRPRGGHPDAARTAARILSVELGGLEPPAFGRPDRRSAC